MGLAHLLILLILLPTLFRVMGSVSNIMLCFRGKSGYVIVEPQIDIMTIFFLTTQESYISF
jgi:hypothetical protein